MILKSFLGLPPKKISIKIDQIWGPPHMCEKVRSHFSSAEESWKKLKLHFAQEGK